MGTKNKNKLRHGFNLVEAAIVLGVVGLIIGGIWSAASSVYLEHKTNQIYSGIMQASVIGRSNITNATIAASLSDNGIERLTRTLLSGKLDGFTGNALDMFGGDFSIGTPLGSGSYFHFDIFDAALGFPVFITVIGPVPQNICLRLLHKASGTIAGDPAGQMLIGVTTSLASGGWIGGFRNPAYALGVFMGLDETTMCPTAPVDLTFYFLPSIN